MDLPVIGLDLAKHVFQVHLIEPGGVALRRALSREEMLPFFEGRPPSLIGVEAAGGANYWGRELRGLGHTVRAIPPKYVKPFRKSNKDDAADAEAIWEAVQRPGMRFTVSRSIEQEAMLTFHSIRRHYVEQMRGLSNRIVGILSERGIVGGLAVATISKDARAAVRTGRVSKILGEPLLALVDDLDAASQRVTDLDKSLKRWVSENPDCRRLMTIPGVGIQSASLSYATLGDPNSYRSGKDFAALIGLAPRHSGSGGKVQIGSIPPGGRRLLRTYLYLGALTSIVQSKKKGFPNNPNLANLVGRKSIRVVRIAQANRIARIIWAVSAHQTDYRPPRVTTGQRRPRDASRDVPDVSSWEGEGGR